MADDKRKVELEDGTVVNLRLPGLVENQKADWEYSKAFNKAIREGIAPREILLADLRENGTWTEEDEIKTDGFNEQMGLLLIDTQEAADSGDNEKFEKCKAELSTLRSEYFAHLQKLSIFLSHSAEEKANEVRILYLVYACSENADGKSFWKSYKEFENDRRPKVVSTVVYNFMLLLNGMSEDFTKDFPENQIKVKGNVESEPVKETPSETSESKSE